MGKWKRDENRSSLTGQVKEIWLDYLEIFPLLLSSKITFKKWMDHQTNQSKGFI